MTSCPVFLYTPRTDGGRLKPEEILGQAGRDELQVGIRRPARPFPELQQFPDILLLVLEFHAPSFSGHAAQLQRAHIQLNLLRHCTHLPSGHRKPSGLGRTNCFVAGPALACFSIGTAERAGVDGQFTRTETGDENFIGKQIRVLQGIRFWPPAQALSPPFVCRSTHSTSNSLITTNRFPIFRTGKLALCINS